MNIVKILFFILISFISVKGQSFFKGSLIVGLNASQIDGDELAGYHKFGLLGGAKVEFPLNSVLDMGIEFLFSQQGSRTPVVPNLLSEPSRLALNYISLPLVLKWSDWWVEDEAYYKFHLHGGLANSYLISSNTDDSPIPVNGELNNYDLSFLIGTGFSFTKKWTLSLRYTRSINTLYKQETSSGQVERGLIGYFITLRSEYNF